MLRQGKKISDKEKAEVKEAARRLLKRLTENEFSVERWTEKVQTASAAKKAVNDYLFTNLPYPTYDEKEIADRTQVLYEFFRHDIGILGGRRDDH